jgi:hypothetical protein
VSADKTGGQFNNVAKGMSRDQVVESLGQPARASQANGLPASDIFACDQQGQIVAVKVSTAGLVTESLLTLGFAGLVDVTKAGNMAKNLRRCEVDYDSSGKVTGPKLY